MRRQAPKEPANRPGDLSLSFVFARTAGVRRYPADANPDRNGSVGWIADVPRSRGERLSRTNFSYSSDRD